MAWSWRNIRWIYSKPILKPRWAVKAIKVMVTIILLAILGGIVGLKVGKNTYSSSPSIDIFFGSVFGTLLGLVFCFIIYIISPKVKTSEVKYIESISDNMGTSGSFFLGSGNVDGQMYFFAYVKEGEYYKVNKYNASVTSIRYTNEKPHLTIIKKSIEKGSFYYYFSLPAKEEHPDLYIFNLPKGSIINKYNLDTK